MSTKTLQMTAQLYSYLLSVSLREPKVLTELRNETHQLKNYRMQISPEQGQLMAWLVELIGAKKTLDIGTFTGYSALCVALALPQDGKVITCDVNKASTDIAKRFWQEAGVLHKIQFYLDPALKTLQTLIDQGEKNTFDFAFIDADKENYLAYYEKSLTLLRPGGVIGLDNVLWDGKVAEPHINDENTVAIRELNDFIYEDDRITMTMLPIGDGLTLVRKRHF